MRVLVTGAAGFIGSHAVEAYAAAGHEVVGFDVLLPAVHPDPEAAKARIPHGTRLIQADVRDHAAVRRALAGVDVVCHQAAMVGLGLDLNDAPDYAGCNDLGTAVLLAAMAAEDVGRLVLASSMVVYGEGRYSCAEHGVVAPGPRTTADLEAGSFEPPCPYCGRPLSPGLVDEDARLDPRNVYAATKAAQEYLATSWARAAGGTVAMLRYHNVYGPRMPRDTPYAGVAAIFRSVLAAGRAPRVFEDGGQRRDFVHVRDVARANVAAAVWTGGDDATPGLGRAFNVGSGIVRTVGELARGLSKALSGPEPVVTGEFRLGDVRHVTADSARLREELGWQPRVAFTEGLAEFAGAEATEGAGADAARAGSNAGSGSGSNAGSGSDLSSNAGSTTGSDSGSDEDASADVDADMDADAETDAEMDMAADSDSDMDSERTIRIPAQAHSRARTQAPGASAAPASAFAPAPTS